MTTLLLVFFLSGVSALAYQIIWIRLFGLVFGGTVVSMSVVVAVFMGGIALGSRVFGKYAERVGNRVRFFGMLELSLGVIGIIVFHAISYFSGIIYWLPFNMQARTPGGIIIRLILSTALLIVPTMIMGGTLPVLVRAVTNEKKNIIPNTSMLYAFNTLGATFGAFLTGIILIRYLGVMATNYFAAAMNITVGITALVISKRFESKPDSVAVETKDDSSAPSQKSGMRFLIALGITGFVGLTVEMVWMRMLLLVLNNTIYLYTIVITCYLLAIGLGGLILRNFVPEKLRKERLFGILLAGISLTISIGYVLFPEVTSIAFGTSEAYYSTFLRLSMLTAIIFFLLGFVPVLLMGMSFPLGLGLYAQNIKGLSGRLGSIYAVNTIGALVGSLASVFIIIPLIGIRGTIILCSLLLIAPALYFIWQERAESSRTALLAVTGTLFVVFALISIRMDIPKSILERKLRPEETIEYLNEGPSSTIWISGGEGAYRKIWIDNLWVSSTSNEGTHALLAHYPMLFHPNPKKVAGIAFGTGQTFGACLLFPIEKMTCVEIDAEIIEACKGRFTEENYGVMEDPRTEIVIDDGRFFMAGTEEKFDIITAEPLQPYTRGTVSLYSYEFYTACRERLLEGGIVAQWLPVYNSGVSDSWSMIRTFSEVFDYVHLFLNGGDGILLGSDKPIRLNPKKGVPVKVAEDMLRIENGNIYALTGNYICSREKLLSVSRNYPIITDNKPSLEFTAPITHWNEDVMGAVEMRRQFVDIMEPLDNVLEGEVNWDLARRFRESRRLINLGFIAESKGDIIGAGDIYQRAYSVNPSDVKGIRALFSFLRRQNQLDRLPQELEFLSRPPQ